MSQDQIREVGKALLPYLRNDLTDAELGMASHDAVAALNRVAGIDRLRAEIHEAIDHLRARNAVLEDALKMIVAGGYDKASRVFAAGVAARALSGTPPPDPPQETEE